jgi:uncharacterized protein YkwD
MRAAALLFAALVLTPAGLAAPQAGKTGVAPRSTGWHSPATAGPTQQQTALASALLREINEVRREYGLKPFLTSGKLSAAAAQHTREMGADGYFEHDSYDSTPFWKRIGRWYPSRGWRSWSVGENLLYSSPDLTATDSVELWMGSPPHRANLLNRTWREIGISAIHFDEAPGEYEGQPVTIVTADFGVRR